MTNYKYLSNHTGSWAMVDKKTGEHKNGVSYYLIVCKEDCCKPNIYPCSADVYKESTNLETGAMINMFFDERQKVSGIKSS